MKSDTPKKTQKVFTPGSRCIYVGYSDIYCEPEAIGITGTIDRYDNEDDVWVNWDQLVRRGCPSACVIADNLAIYQSEEELVLILLGLG